MYTATNTAGRSRLRAAPSRALHGENEGLGHRPRSLPRGSHGQEMAGGRRYRL